MKRWIQKGTSFSVKRYLSDECFYSLLLDFAFEFGDEHRLNVERMLKHAGFDVDFDDMDNMTIVW